MFLLPGSPQHILGDLENIEKQAAMLNYNSGELARDLERVLGRLRNGQGYETGTELYFCNVILWKPDLFGFVRLIRSHKIMP